MALPIDNKQLTKIASIGIGAVLAITLVVIGFKIIQGVFTKAADIVPRDIVINGIGENGAKIAWTTDQDSQAVIEYGTSPTSLNFFAPESQKTKNHTLDMSLLSPATTYYFQIRIGDKKYDNSGVPWTFTTKAKGVADVTPTIPPTASQSSSIAAVPTVPAVTTPRPTSSLIIPSPVPTVPLPTPTVPIVYTCGSTDCTQICQKIWKTIPVTCGVRDWFASGCQYRLIAPVTCVTITPSVTPSPTIVPTATLTPSLTPTTTLTPSPTPTPTTSITPTPTASSSSSS